MAKKDKPTDTKAKEGAQDANGPQFAIQRVYIKDMSLETPNSPQVFLDKWEPVLNMDLATTANKLNDEGIYEVVLTVTVTVKLGEAKDAKTAFLVEVKQGGIFSLVGFDEEQLKPMLGSFCPNVLYPYAREVVTDAVMRAGFPQLYLAPVNFDALYQQQQESAAAKN
ncbi:MAG: protein-export chaperone SecB [Gammaproteobacteria bacterium]|nr:protein-export chaperone SecB [Gammaproteobacteria bacterium]